VSTPGHTPPDHDRHSSGRARPAPESVLAQIADAEISLRSLLLNLPAYARQFSAIAKAPAAYLRAFDYTAANALKRAVAFMLQGITLGFLILTIGIALPRSIARDFAASPFLFESREQILAYAGRIERVKKVLSAELSRQFLAKAELDLIVRVLPDDRFDKMIERLQHLSVAHPDMVRSVLGTSEFFGDGFGGRSFALGFLLLLGANDPTIFQKVHEIGDLGPKYQLKPHVEFLLRLLIAWYVTCFVTTRLLRRWDNRTNTAVVFAVGAYLVGVATPVLQAFHAARNIYLASVLPRYIEKASCLLVSPAAPDCRGALAGLAGGIFPFENLGLGLAGIGIPTSIAAIAVFAFAGGLEGGCRLSARKAWAVTGIGLGLGLIVGEIASDFGVFALAASGLL
jgi:hypothetical protein